MKHLFLFLTMLLILLSCSQQETTPQNALVGTWQLQTYCKSQSTGCVTTTVPTDKRVLVEFGNDGSFRETYGNVRYEGYGFLGGPGSYTLEGDNVRIVTVVMSSLSGVVFKLVSVNTNRLVLNRVGVGDYVFTR